MGDIVARIIIGILLIGIPLLLGDAVSDKDDIFIKPYLKGWLIIICIGILFFIFYLLGGFAIDFYRFIFSNIR